jgi:hypothetical protein
MGDSLQLQQRNPPALSTQDCPIHSERTMVHKQPQAYPALVIKRSRIIPGF